MTGRRSVLIGCLSLLAAGTALTGCGGPPPKPPPPPPVLTVIMTGGADQNPDGSGNAQPVAVHLYQLVSPAKFERADFYALTDREQQTLGSDNLGSQSFVLAPSESRTLTIEPGPTLRELGVVVEYRDIDQAKWRAVAPVATSGPTRLELGIGKLAVTLKPAG